MIPIYRKDEQHPQAQACAACEMRSSALFGALDLDQLDRIHMQIDDLSFGADSTIYGVGSAGSAVYTVRSGVVRCQRVNDRGERRIVRLAGPGDLIGQEALLHRSYAEEAVACNRVEVCRIPRALIDTLTESSGNLPLALMARWQDALESTEAWMTEMSFGPARRRVLRLLARLQNFAGADGKVWLPRRGEMGSMLNLAQETASRQISALRAEKVLRIVPVRSARIDAQALQRALQAEDAQP